MGGKGRSQNKTPLPTRNLEEGRIEESCGTTNAKPFSRFHLLSGLVLYAFSHCPSSLRFAPRTFGSSSVSYKVSSVPPPLEFSSSSVCTKKLGIEYYLASHPKKIIMGVNAPTSCTKYLQFFEESAYVLRLKSSSQTFSTYGYWSRR